MTAYPATSTTMIERALRMTAQRQRFDWLRTGVALQGGVAADAFASLGGRELAAGERVGPFAIVDELGRGGMAIVYAAKRADGEFEQQAAIKWMPGGAQGETAALLFRRERQILAELRHPNIARLIDGGRAEDGMLWFAMERVDGLRLDHHLAGGHADPVSEQLRLFLQVCAALGFAHSRGLVHRDIKPANIAVDADGSVKLLDFGVALLAEHDVDSVRHAYTPAWASPEQLLGEVTGPASDIYQLGLLLQWLRRGGDNAAAMAGWRRESRLRQRELDAISERALAGDPQDRYASVRELERDIEAWQGRRPVAAYAGGTLHRLGLLVRRHRVGSGLLALAIAVLIALSLGFTWRIAQERDHAIAAAKRADAARDFLVSLFSGADPTVRKGVELSARDLLDRGEARIGAELAGQPALRGDLQESLGSVYNFLAEAERAERLVLASLVDLDGSNPAQRVDAARRRLLLASIYSRSGRSTDALAQTDLTLAALDGVAEDQALELELGALNLRAKVFKQLERGDQAAHALERLLMRVDASPNAQEHRAFAADNLAHVYEVQGRWSEALAQAEVAEKAFFALRGRDHPEPWAVAAYHAGLQYATRDLDGARTRLAEVLSAQQRLYAADDRRIMNTRTSLARVALRQGDIGVAGELLGAALSDCERQFGASHAECPLTWQIHGEWLARRGEMESALRALRESVALRAATGTTNHRGLALAQMALANALCAKEPAAEGRAELERARRNLDGALPAPLDIELLAAAEAACRER